MISTQTNVSALSAVSALRTIDRACAAVEARLATGQRIQSAADDSAGLALSVTLRAELLGLQQAVENSMHAVTLVQTAEAHMDSIVQMAHRMRELATQAQNGTLSDADRAMLDLEFQGLKDQMHQTAAGARWNHVQLLNREASSQTGPVAAVLSPDSQVSTLQPPTGAYSFFINGVEVPVSLVAGESAASRLQKVMAAVAAGQSSHGAVAVLNGGGGLTLRTPDGRDLSAWYDSTVPGLRAASFGFGGTNAVAQVHDIELSDSGGPVPQVTQTASYIEFSGYGLSGETLSFSSTGTASTAANAVSVVGNTVYQGDGSSARIIGTVDAVKNGVAGQALRVNFNSFPNGDFEIGAVGTTNVSGWVEYNQRAILNGLTSIAGSASPLDLTTPLNSLGDASPLQNQGVYTTQLVAADDAARGTKSLQLRSALIDLAMGHGFGVVRGPYVVSESSVSLAAGESVSFDWRASGGDDAYDVYAYLLNTTTGQTVKMLDASGSNMGMSTPWTTVSASVPSAGSYKFVFVSGTYDASGGRAAGAQLFIDNIRVPQPALNAAALQTLVQYANTSTFTATAQINGVTLTSAASADAAAAAASLQIRVEQALQTGALKGISASRSGSRLTLRSTSPGDAFTVSGLSVSAPHKSIAGTGTVPNAVGTHQITPIAQATALSTGAAVATGGTVQTVVAAQPDELRFQIGAQSNEFIAFKLPDLSRSSLALGALTWDTDPAALQAATGVSGETGRKVAADGRTSTGVTSVAAAAQAVGQVEGALQRILAERARLGGTINRLVFAADQVAQKTVDVSQSRSRIMDTDYAAESAELLRHKARHEAATSVLDDAQRTSEVALTMINNVERPR